MKFGTRIFWFYLVPIFATLLIVGFILGSLVNRGYKNVIIENYKTTAKNLINREILVHLTPADFTEENHEAFENFYKSSGLIALHSIRMKFFNENGVLVHLDHPDWMKIVLESQNLPVEGRVREALKGNIIANALKAPFEDEEDVRVFEKQYNEILSVYYPVRFNGQSKVYGAVEAYFELDSLNSFIYPTVRLIWVYIAIGFLIVFLLALSIYNYTSRLYAQQIELRSALNEQLTMKKMENQFIRIMAHQLRTPLTAISGNLDIILQNFRKQIPSEAAEALTDAATSYNRLSFLSEKILALLDLEKTLTMQVESVNLDDIVAEVTKSFKELVKDKGLDFKISMGKIPGLYGHSRYLKILVNEYLDNAIKFTSSGKITIKTYTENNHAILEVEDTGVGIAPELKKDLFSRSKVTQKPLEELHGMGIGLYIAKLIAQRHDGDAWVESQPGKGSKFFASFSLDKK